MTSPEKCPLIAIEDDNARLKKFVGELSVIREMFKTR